MAMRSLISKLSGRTGRMPLSAGAAALKDNPGMKGFASSKNTTKCDSIKQEAEINDFKKKKFEAIKEEIRLDMEEHGKLMRAYNRNTALFTLAGLGVCYYLWCRVKEQSKRRCAKEQSMRRHGIYALLD